MNSTLTRRTKAGAGILALCAAGLAAAPAAAAEPSTRSAPDCQITQLANTNPDDSPYEGTLDWWAVAFTTSAGLADWSYHLPNKSPDEAWIYDYYLRADLAASEAAGHLVIPHAAGASYFDLPDGGQYFWLLVPDDAPAPVVDCIPG